jgi:hypothetical protein
MSPRSSPRPRHRTTLALALLLASVGCAGTKASREWSDSALTKDRYERVMVLALLPNFARRQTAEDRIVAELVRQGVTAVRSWDVLSQEEVAERERIAGAVAASGADALLGVRVASLERDKEVYEGREQWVPVATGIDYYGYVTTAYGLYRKPEVAELLTVTVETTLWDVGTRRMVWACQSDSVSANQTLTTTELADDYAGVVMKKVRPYLRGR